MTTHQKRFKESCKVSDFESHPGTLGGYKVWGVTDIVKGGREQFHGPYFTETEASISAELWSATPDRRYARTEASVHCAAWNPDPAREVPIRRGAAAARMILAELVGVDIPKPSASRS